LPRDQPFGVEERIAVGPFLWYPSISWVSAVAEPRLYYQQTEISGPIGQALCAEPCCQKLSRHSWRPTGDRIPRRSHGRPWPGGWSRRMIRN